VADVDGGRLRALADEAPVVTVVDALLRDALRLGASDVHLEPAADGVRVRFRLDGVLRTCSASRRRCARAS
jgi:type II secretory ATPase GspE/PulE/Tfp pilus assembly ATPase PilB-like protein